MLTDLLTWLFFLALAVQCAYATWFLLGISRLGSGKAASGGRREAVSVVICARNEARNLEANLPEILAQRYRNEDGNPMYEVIVVNDASEDDTERVLYELEQQHGHLWHVTINKDTPRDYKGKKFALGIGVKHAGNDWLVLTDADCRPATQDWLSEITAPLGKGMLIAAGYGAQTVFPGFLNAFIRWETLHTFLQYATYTLFGRPYMAVGRNLSCTREVFLKAQSYKVWNSLPSGDDDLLIQACATGENMDIVASGDSFTLTEPKKSFTDWLKQKQRHVSTGKYYHPMTKFLLGIYGFSHAFTWILFFLLLLLARGNGAFFGLMIIRSLAVWTVWALASIRMKERSFLLWIPLCDLGWVVYNLVLSPYIFLKNKKQWR